jgi:hypothetical protein
MELTSIFLHFTDNETMGNFEEPEELFKNFSVILHLNNKFQELYLPNQDISTDVPLTLQKGYPSFKQYLPLKASKFGIKTYELCDPSLYIQARIQNLTPPLSQLTPVKQQPQF